MIVGRNHVILNLSRKILDAKERLSPSAATGKAIVAQSAWSINEFRPYHDLIVPPVVGPPGGETWMESPYMLPARRKYLLSFQGFVTFNNITSSDDSNSFSSKWHLLFSGKVSTYSPIDLHFIFSQIHYTTFNFGDI